MDKEVVTEIPHWQREVCAEMREEAALCTEQGD